MDRTVRVVRPSGEVRWLRVMGQPWRTPEGKVVTDGLAIDITEQRQTEERLRESERSRGAIASNLPGIVFQTVVDAGHQLRFTYVSPSVSRVVGITAEEMMTDAERFLATIHPDDRKLYRRAVQERSTNPVAPDHEFRIIRPDGAVRWLRSIATTWRHPSGEVVIDGIALDITAQREAEERLRNQDQLLTTLTDNLPAAVLRWVQRPDGSARCAFVAGALEKLTGLTVEGVLDGSTPMFSRVHSDDRAACLTAQRHAAAELTKLDQEFRFRMPDDEVRWLRWIGCPTPGLNGEVYIDGILFDVTEQRQAIKELDRRNRDLVSLCRISEIALKSPNLDAGLRDIVEEIGRVAGSDMVSVGLYNESLQVIDFRVLKQFDTGGAELAGLRLPIEKSLAGEVTRTGLIVLERRCLEHTESRFAHMHEIGHQTFIGAPIRVGQRVIGCIALTIVDDIEIPRHMVDLVSVWADYIASFIASQGAEEVTALLVPERRSKAFESAFSQLTPRQRDVLAELATGKSNKEIAHTLGLHEASVKIHVRAIFKALGTVNRIQTATLANAAFRVHRQASP